MVGVINWMMNQNHYIEKMVGNHHFHPFKTGCLGYQVQLPVVSFRESFRFFSANRGERSGVLMVLLGLYQKIASSYQILSNIYHVCIYLKAAANTIAKIPIFLFAMALKYHHHIIPQPPTHPKKTGVHYSSRPLIAQRLFVT